MLRRLDASSALGERPAPGSDDEVTDTVRRIVAEVRAGGDAALRAITQRLDGVGLDDLAVPAAEVKAALEDLPRELRAALHLAAARIRAYHEAQIAGDAPVGIDADGVSVTEVVRAVARAGLYVPGGRAAYPSTVLMTAIPARVAGVGELVLCVPPGPDGRPPPVTLAAAALTGVEEVYRVGGAQAIAALAYGTESIGAVDVIVGPGNAYVSAAKREVAADGVVGIESPAGPSELVVVADASAPARWIAADLAAQSEHGPGGRAVLVTWHEPLVAEVDGFLAAILGNSVLPNRAELESTLASSGRAIVVRDAEEAMAVANSIAPEHLEIVTSDPESLLPLVRNAGAVFLGAATPTAYGDYVAGANHVLPTGGAARFASALRVDDFRKHVHVVRASESVAESALARAGETIARAEGLEVHAWSIAVRGAPGP